MNGLHRLWLLALVALGGCLGVAREQSAIVYFKTTTTSGYEKLWPRKAQIKDALLKDERLLDTLSLDPQQKRGPEMDGWMLSGSRGKEFEGISVAFTRKIDNTKPVAGSAWIMIDCKAREVRTEKIKSLKALITSVVGKPAMSEIEISVSYENMFIFGP